uniref:Uncharacterized protein n=1 Tax=Cucumis melo TaxID=3656 RepID=A0A1S3CKM2_CUCME
MADQHKKALETSHTSKLIPEKDASFIQPQAKHLKVSKKPESSSKKSRSEGSRKKILLKPQTQTSSPQAHFVKPDLEQAQRPKKDATDFILDIDELMGQKENICKGLPNLEPGMETMWLDKNQPRYKHTKHGVSKVLVSHIEASDKEGTQVPSQFFDKVLEFIKELEAAKRKKSEVVERKKSKDEKRKEEERKKQKKDEERTLQEEWGEKSKE